MLVFTCPSLILFKKILFIDFRKRRGRKREGREDGRKGEDREREEKH